ncbi:hypothetical protein EV361DRAFT_936356 [Lentinula raphanica]|nr:hypothetical protein EV361DRAFT_936356 [Lentinula raphanica]
MTLLAAYPLFSLPGCWSILQSFYYPVVNFCHFFRAMYLNPVYITLALASAVYALPFNSYSKNSSHFQYARGLNKPIIKATITFLGAHDGPAIWRAPPDGEAFFDGRAAARKGIPALIFMRTVKAVESIVPKELLSSHELIPGFKNTFKLGQGLDVVNVEYKVYVYGVPPCEGGCRFEIDKNGIMPDTLEIELHDSESEGDSQ